MKFEIFRRIDGDYYYIWFRYDLEFKQEFWFEKSQHTEYLAKLPMRFVWGVSPEDNGNYLEPGVKGSLVLDPTFHMASPESQVCTFLQNSNSKSNIYGAERIVFMADVAVAVL